MNTLSQTRIMDWSIEKDDEHPKPFHMRAPPPEKHVLSYKDHILDINKINAVLVKVFAKQHNWSNLYMYIILIW